MIPLREVTYLVSRSAAAGASSARHPLPTNPIFKKLSNSRPKQIRYNTDPQPTSGVPQGFSLSPALFTDLHGDSLHRPPLRLILVHHLSDAPPLAQTVGTCRDQVRRDGNGPSTPRTSMPIRIS